MIAALIVYVVCAAVLMIWSTLLGQPPGLKQNPQSIKSEIDYVLIPSFLFLEWTVCYLNLLVFDLREVCERETRHEQIPGSLYVRADELQYLFRWLPPRSTIVLVAARGVPPLTPAVENQLAKLGIDTVYFVDRTAKFPEAIAWSQFVHK